MKNTSLMAVVLLWISSSFFSCDPTLRKDGGFELIIQPTIYKVSENDFNLAARIITQRLEAFGLPGLRTFMNYPERTITVELPNVPHAARYKEMIFNNGQLKICHSATILECEDVKKFLNDSISIFKNRNSYYAGQVVVGEILEHDIDALQAIAESERFRKAFSGMHKIYLGRVHNADRLTVLLTFENDLFLDKNSLISTSTQALDNSYTILQMDVKEAERHKLKALKAETSRPILTIIDDVVQTSSSSSIGFDSYMMNLHGYFSAEQARVFEILMNSPSIPIPLKLSRSRIFNARKK